MNGSLGLTPSTQLDSHIYVILLTSKYAMESYERVLAYKLNHYIIITRYSPLSCTSFSIILSSVMHGLSITDFLLFCSNSARKCLKNRLLCLKFCRQNLSKPTNQKATRTPPVTLCKQLMGCFSLDRERRMVGLDFTTFE